MTGQLDPRVHAYRPDLADRRLEGRVTASRFVDGEDRRVVATAAPMRRAPRHDAGLETEALHGERVRIFEEREGWAWGQLATDGYVGWLQSSTVGPSGQQPTHRVSALRTFVFPGPDIKLPPTMLLSMGALVAVHSAAGALADTDAGFIPLRHLAPLDQSVPDWVAVALRFVGTPYLWGGRTSLGLDCSALIQLALAAAGIAGPRDSDMQACGLGTAIDHADPARLTRGDLLFWNGHVAIVLDDGQLLHANGHHMETVIEPLQQAVARIAGMGLEVTGARRVGVV